MSKTALKTVENEETGVVAGVEEIVIATDPLDPMDAMFADLEAGLTVALQPTVYVGTEEEQIAAGRVIDSEYLRAEAMKEIDETSTPLSDDSKKPEAQSAKKPGTTKRISTMGLAKSVALANALGENMDTMLTIDAADLELTEESQFDKRIAMLEAIDALPVKIGEKVTNFYAHLAKGAALSNYTVKAIEHLVAEGEMTSKSLKDVYLARPYTDGTASSQTTQMMKLLPLLGLATRVGNKLIKNADSLLLPMLAKNTEAEAA